MRLFRRKNLIYDPDTGKITRTNRTWNSLPGDEVTLQNVRGYNRVYLEGKPVYAHRFAWWMVYGYWPTELDHINGVRDDNRIVNLREVTRSENIRNTCLRKDNKSGIPGVDWHKPSSLWRVRCGDEYIGYYKDFFEACCARKSAENKLGYHVNHGRNV